MKDLAEVCPLSRETFGIENSHLYPPYCREAFAFFRFPVPAIPLARLTTAYRRSEDIGLTMFRINNQVG